MVIETDKGAHIAPKQGLPAFAPGAKSGSPLMRTLPVEIAGLVMLVGGIALLLGFPLPPIRVHRPLLSCPLLVLGRSFLPVRPRVVAG